MIRLFDLLADQRRAILFALIGLGVVGAAAGFRLPLAIFPEVTFPRLKVIAQSGERPSEEMLRAVTRPLEQTVRRVPGVHEMRSTTSRGSTELNLDFEWGSDMDLALQRVEAQVSAIRETFPAGTTIDARLMNPVLFPIVGYSITSTELSPAELRDVALMEIQPELARLPGVAEVVVQGGRRLEARVVLDPSALESRGIDAALVARVLRESAELSSAGLLDANNELYLGVIDGRPTDLASLESLPVPLPGGTPVPLGALGRVSLEEAPEFVRFAAQSRDAVLINIMRQPDASTVGVSDAARDWFREHRATLPSGLRIEAYYDQAELVRSSVRSVYDSLLAGTLMAVVVIALFLRSVRLGMVGALVLPAGIAFTLLGFVLTRQSLNMMTLGGIAAAIGLVLDDAIVVVEHLTHRAHADRTAGLSRGMAGILPTLLGSSLCTIAIFVPFILLSGVTGAFFRVLALSMTLMLAASFAICTTLIPLLWRAGLHPAPAPPAQPDAHQPGGGRAVIHPRVAWIVVAALLVAVVPLVRSLGTAFLPEMDEGSLIMDYKSPPGTSVAQTDRILRGVEREIAATPEISAWSRRTGEQLGFFTTEPNTGDYVLRLRPGKRRSAEDVMEDLRRRLEGSEPRLEVEFGQLVEDVIGDLTSNPQPVEIRVFGEDRRLVEEKAREIAGLITRVPGVVDVVDGVIVSGSNLVLAPGGGARALGVSAATLAEGVEPLVGGIEAGQISRGARSWPIRVVVPAAGGPSPAAALADQRVPLGTGRWGRLGDLARLRVEPGETEINRDDQRTMIPVTARLFGRDMGSAVAEIQRLVRTTVPLPRDMSVRYAGLWAEQQASFRSLLTVLLAAVAAVVLILIAAFRSWRQVAAVLAVVTAALPGTLAALKLTGMTLNIASFVGAIMTVGIVAENAFFLVASFRGGLDDGLDPLAAARSAGRRRTRPVLMTTTAGVIALLPLAIGLGAGSALLRPLAIAVIGGFTLSAPLLLLVLPALLAGFKPRPPEMVVAGPPGGP